MVEILKESREFTEIEKYLMTISPAIKSMKDVADNTSIEVSGVMLFNDIKDDDEPTEIMSIITPENVVYSCQSKTFKRSVYDIMNIMGDKPFAIVKTSGTTKAGRDFINAILDISKISVD